MTNNQTNLLLEHMVEKLELPEAAYQKAEERYRDLGNWLGRDESKCAIHKPHIFPQGSFRLGTAIRPLDEKEEYDLDLACELQDGVTKKSHTQKALKNLVGLEIKSYRAARGIKAEVEEKHRCWRLEYADRMSFHMDVVPCIPSDDSGRKLVFASMTKAGESQDISTEVSDLSVSITDDRHPRYDVLAEDWNVSNPEGYARWFESRMRQIQKTILEKAHIEQMPIYRRKSPLQRVVQLLKRHRDQMFKDDKEIKPISIIITTLAARAYQGETDIGTALSNVLARMGGLVNKTIPRVPNPVNPDEDFADRWSMPEYRHLRLEENFWRWLQQAQSDLISLSRPDVSFLVEQMRRKFSVSIDSNNLSKRLGIPAAAATTIDKPNIIISKEPPKPWARIDK